MSSGVSGAFCEDELCFDFLLAPSICFRFSDPELVGVSVGFLLRDLSLGFARGGASVISLSDSEEETMDAGFLKAFGASSSSETLSVLLPSAEFESEPILPGLPTPNPMGRNRIFRPLGWGRTGFFAATVAFEEAASVSSVPGTLTIRCR